MENLIRIKGKMYFVEGNKKILISNIFIHPSKTTNIRQANKWLERRKQETFNKGFEFQLFKSMNDDHLILVTRSDTDWELYIPDLRKIKPRWYRG